MNSTYSHHLSAVRLTPSAEERASTTVRNLRSWQAAVREIGSWPEYAVQPLHDLERTARRLGVAKLFYKDESQRFGQSLASFKALGAPYAVSCLLADAVEAQTGHRPSAADLRGDKFRPVTERVTVCVATDGNQGRGLAFAAKTFGCRCVVYIHGHVSSGRKQAMERYGAIVIRIDGEYEASVARAKEDARMNGWHFVSSTSWDDFASPIPRAVMNGYMVMIEEALAQIPDLSGITHVLAQGGVGSIAAAIFLGFKQRCGAKVPRFVMVEPIEADCLYQSAIHRRPTPAAGTLRTVMAGLACREVSPAAWAIIDWLASDFIAIPDDWALDAMRALADGEGDIPIVSGETAAGGMGVMLKAASEPELRRKLDLTSESQVVLFGLEGATDPDIYRDIVGAAPSLVFDRQAQWGRTM